MSEEITPYQVVPKTPLAGSAAGDIREQGEITRRNFPFVLTAAWLALNAGEAIDERSRTATSTTLANMHIAADLGALPKIVASNRLGA